MLPPAAVAGASAEGLNNRPDLDFLSSFGVLVR